MAEAYTLATYRVRPGMEQDFIDAWDELAATFSATLLASALALLPGRVIVNVRGDSRGK